MRGDKGAMLVKAAKGLAKAVLDFALPPRCPGCGEVQDEDGLFCGACWGRLSWLSGGCQRCGLPLQAGDADECGRCLAEPPPFDRIRSAVAYGEVPKMLVTKLKYGRKVGLARTMARYMAPIAGMEEAVLVPVPLHRWRLWGRGFNQSLLLARSLQAMGKGRADPSLLRRTRATRPLKGLSARQRRNETRGAFEARKRGGDEPQRRIILVDDVLTSGSTGDACARALRKAGWHHVELLTFARVVGHAGTDWAGERFEG